MDHKSYMMSKLNKEVKLSQRDRIDHYYKLYDHLLSRQLLLRVEQHI